MRTTLRILLAMIITMATLVYLMPTVFYALLEPVLLVLGSLLKNNQARVVESVFPNTPERLQISGYPLPGCTHEPGKFNPQTVEAAEDYGNSTAQLLRQLTCCNTLRENPRNFPLTMASGFVRDEDGRPLISRPLFVRASEKREFRNRLHGCARQTITAPVGKLVIVEPDILDILHRIEAQSVRMQDTARKHDCFDVRTAAGLSSVLDENDSRTIHALSKSEDPRKLLEEYTLRSTGEIEELRRDLPRMIGVSGHGFMDAAQLGTVLKELDTYKAVPALGETPTTWDKEDKEHLDIAYMRVKLIHREGLEPIPTKSANPSGVPQRKDTAYTPDVPQQANRFVAYYNELVRLHKSLKAKYPSSPPPNIPRRLRRQAAAVRDTLQQNPNYTPKFRMPLSDRCFPVEVHDKASKLSRSLTAIWTKYCSPASDNGKAEADTVTVTVTRVRHQQTAAAM